MHNLHKMLLNLHIYYLINSRLPNFIVKQPGDKNECIPINAEFRFDGLFEDTDTLSELYELIASIIFNNGSVLLQTALYWGGNLKFPKFLCAPQSVSKNFRIKCFCRENENALCVVEVLCTAKSVLAYLIYQKSSRIYNLSLSHPNGFQKNQSAPYTQNDRHHSEARIHSRFIMHQPIYHGTRKAPFTGNTQKMEKREKQVTLQHNTTTETFACVCVCV